MLVKCKEPDGICYWKKDHVVPVPLLFKPKPGETMVWKGNPHSTICKSEGRCWIQEIDEAYDKAFSQ